MTWSYSDEIDRCSIDGIWKHRKMELMIGWIIDRPFGLRYRIEAKANTPDRVCDHSILYVRETKILTVKSSRYPHGRTPTEWTRCVRIHRLWILWLSDVQDWDPKMVWDIPWSGPEPGSHKCGFNKESIVWSIVNGFQGAESIGPHYRGHARCTEI